MLVFLLIILIIFKTNLVGVQRAQHAIEAHVLAHAQVPVHAVVLRTVTQAAADVGQLRAHRAPANQRVAARRRRHACSK